MLIDKQATARACSNIAFIKYWGNIDHELRLPSNASISMNLADLYTETSVHWDKTLNEDQLTLNGKIAIGASFQRVSNYLDRIRLHIGVESYAQVSSQNNFPMGAGIASSASAFAALALAATTASGKPVSERELTTLARLGSGSASRSIPSGFVEWHMAETHEESYAESFASPDHWDLMDVVAIVSDEHKTTVSQDGHRSAHTSILQKSRVAHVASRLSDCKQAILDKDFDRFAMVVEEDSNLMHAIMMTSQPPLFYWRSTTLTVMQAVRDWRASGLQVCYTLDAGPNVHCICLREDAEKVRSGLIQVSGVLDVRKSPPGDAAQIINPA